MKIKRVAFAGSSELSIFFLKKLIKSKYKLILIITKLNSKKIKNIAIKNNISFIQPISLTDRKIKKIIYKFKLDIIIVISYGLIFPEDILSIPKFGCINVHFSILPKWRGAAPTQRSIEFGDIKTGVSIIQMNNILDSGDILCQKKCTIDSFETNLTLNNKLKIIGINLLFKTLKNYFFLEKNKKKQINFLATYAKKINKNELKINWADKAINIERSIRAFNPYPAKFFYFNQKIIKIKSAIIINNNIKKIPGTILNINSNGIEIATGLGSIEINSIHPENRKIMSVKDFLNSKKNFFYKNKILN